jgi:hypothetical protein
MSGFVSKTWTRKCMDISNFCCQPASCPSTWCLRAEGICGTTVYTEMVDCFLQKSCNGGGRGNKCSNGKARSAVFKLL